MPGYYTVRLPSAGVTAELTATNRTGVGRFHYPHDRAARFFVRPGGSLGGTSAAKIQIGEDNSTITGSATSGGFCGKNNVYTVYFVMKFNKPFTSFGTWDGLSVFPNGRSAYSSYQGDSGGYVEFPAGTELEVRTALSYVTSTARARTWTRRLRASTTSARLPHKDGTLRSRASRLPATPKTTSSPFIPRSIMRC